MERIKIQKILMVVGKKIFKIAETYVNILPVIFI